MCQLIIKIIILIIPPLAIGEGVGVGSIVAVVLLSVYTVLVTVTPIKVNKGCIT